ncbi:MAG: 4Fe-4S binding protein [Eggerthellaceae bacterium]
MYRLPLLFEELPEGRAHPGGPRVAQHPRAVPRHAPGAGELRLERRRPASTCVGCGACESVCPQHIEIVEELVAPPSCSRRSRHDGDRPRPG